MHFFLEMEKHSEIKPRLKWDQILISLQNTFCAIFTFDAEMTYSVNFNNKVGRNLEERVAYLYQIYQK